MLTRLLLVVIPVAMLTACGGYTIVKPERVSSGGHYSVKPSIEWNREARGHTETWTIDGPLLQQIRFLSGLEDGDRMFPGGLLANSRREKRKPAFREDMTPPEIVEFFQASLARVVAGNIEATRLRPERFGNLAGFRFDFEYALEDGLDRAGFAVATVSNEKLYMIVYAAPRMYYYARHKDNAEQLIRTIKMEIRTDPKVITK